jgi:hypothetical protein
MKHKKLKRNEVYDCDRNNRTRKKLAQKPQKTTFRN